MYNACGALLNSVKEVAEPKGTMAVWGPADQLSGFAVQCGRTG
jgi:hypothetical protein